MSLHELIVSVGLWFAAIYFAIVLFAELNKRKGNYIMTQAEAFSRAVTIAAAVVALYAFFSHA
jgi:hypothetical protein